MAQSALWQRQLPAFFFFLYGAWAVRSLLPDCPWPVTRSPDALLQKSVVSFGLALILYLWARWSHRRLNDARLTP